VSAKTEYRCVVLFEDEVRAAAKLLAKFFEPAARDPTGEEAISIIEACYAALQGAEDDSAVVMLGRKPIESAVRSEVAA